MSDRGVAHAAFCGRVTIFCCGSSFYLSRLERRLVGWGVPDMRSVEKVVAGVVDMVGVMVEECAEVEKCAAAQNTKQERVWR